MLRSLYVDDLSLSLEDADKAYQLYLNSKEIMAQGGFNLRKWLTNSRPLMEKRVSVKCGPDGGWRTINSGWKNADGKMQMIKCGWKNADDKM